MFPAGGGAVRGVKEPAPGVAAWQNTGRLPLPLPPNQAAVADRPESARYASKVMTTTPPITTVKALCELFIRGSLLSALSDYSRASRRGPTLATAAAVPSAA